MVVPNVLTEDMESVNPVLILRLSRTQMENASLVQLLVARSAKLDHKVVAKDARIPHFRLLMEFVLVLLDRF